MYQAINQPLLDVHIQFDYTFSNRKCNMYSSVAESSTRELDLAGSIPSGSTPFAKLEITNLKWNLWEWVVTNQSNFGRAPRPLLFLCHMQRNNPKALAKVYFVLLSGWEGRGGVGPGAFGAGGHTIIFIDILWKN